MNQPNPMAKKIADALARKAQELQAQKAGVVNQVIEEAPEDLNNLPLPWKQEIADKWVQWYWPVTQYVTVYAIMFIHDYTDKHGTTFPKGSWNVQCSNDIAPVGEQPWTFDLDAEDALAIGLALASAAKWEFRWKDFAGYFLEKNLLGQDPVPDFPKFKAPPEIHVVKDKDAEK